MLKLSLIIPVYNEEHHIKACLDAVSHQSVMPYEVLVIDNNCTDNTVKIAESYPFVRVIREKKQGLIAARNKGFNSATGDILGRIDGDSAIREDWVENVVQNFTEDTILAGLTGYGKADLLPGTHKVKSTYYSWCYLWFISARFRTKIMRGANMAIRSVVWQEIKHKVTLDDTAVHEDQDISVWIAVLGKKIEICDNVRVTINGQSYRYLPKFFYYSRLHTKTLKLHKKNGNISNTNLRRIRFSSIARNVLLASLTYIPFVLINTIIFFPIDWLALRFIDEKVWLD